MIFLQVEPQLKYERMGNDLNGILNRDAASCLAVHSKVAKLHHSTALSASKLGRECGTHLLNLKLVFFVCECMIAFITDSDIQCTIVCSTNSSLRLALTGAPSTFWTCWGTTYEVRRCRRYVAHRHHACAICRVDLPR